MQLLLPGIASQKIQREVGSSVTNPTMKILYGPPGTGKTWQAAQEAVKAIEPQRYQQAQASTDPLEEIRKLHETLVNDGRIIWVTFHPSYSYEDFVEGFRPSIGPNEQLLYTVVEGPFKTICRRATLTSDLSVGDMLEDGNGKKTMEVVNKNTEGWFVKVNTTRADAVAASTTKFVPRAVIERVIELGLPPTIFSIPGKSLIELSKVGLDMYDPDLPGPEKGETAGKRNGANVRKIIAARTGVLSSSDLSNQAHFGAVLRRLMELKTSGGQQGGAVAMVIDEINRAEPSKVFGELITLLELDKREGMPDERSVWLPYSKKPFSVPANVSVIGTMNTVDRSLTALDFAMRRRFTFELVAADPNLVPQDWGGADLQALLKRINSRVGILLGSGHEFGHAFLMPRRLKSLQTDHGWDGADAALRAVAYVLRTSIIPTLTEYFHDDWDKVRAVAGETKDDQGVLSLFEKPPADAQFFARLPDQYEFSESSWGVHAEWWNPEGQKWDSDRFLRFARALANGQ